MKKDFRKLLCILLAGMMLTAASGCGMAPKDSGAESKKKETSAVEDSKGESKEESAAAEESAESAPLEERLKIEKPWLNTTFDGSVTDAYNPSVKDDFFAAVNRDFLMEEPIKAGYPYAAAFSKLEEEVTEKGTGLLTDTSLKSHEAGLVQNYYTLLLDWEQRNAQDYSKTVGAYLDTVKNIGSIDELTSYLTSEECHWFGASLGMVGVGIDDKNSSSYAGYIGTTTLSLYDSAEYNEKTDTGERYLQTFEADMKNVLGHLGYEEKDIKDLSDKRLSFEKKIAPSIMTTVEQAAPEAIDSRYNPVTMEELKSMSPAYPAADILVAQKLDKAPIIILSEPKWLEKMNELYTEENLEELKAYLITEIAWNDMELMDEEIYRQEQKDSSDIWGSEPGTDEEEAYISVHKALTVPFSKLYAETYLSQEMKEDILGMISEIVAYYKEMLQTEDWLGEETRNKAIEKLDAMKYYAAYPSTWKDYSKLDIGTAKEGETLMSAAEKIGRFEEEYVLSVLHSPIDYEQELMSDTLTVNAYYMPNGNSVNIIGGILGGSFYDASRSRTENLASIGSVIGHEISHAFDTNGAQYDKNGNVENWWTDADNAEFGKKADRLANYFSTMVYDSTGKTYNGKLIQTECIADLAGVKSAYGVASKEKDFDAKTFFESYARVWGYKGLRSYQDMLFVSDVHASPHLRVNAVLQQFPEFLETYGIKEGDGMYLAPEDRVTVW